MADVKPKGDLSVKTKVNLLHDITINGVRFPAGKGVEVPRHQAEDITRMDHEHQQYLNNLNRKRIMEVDAGTIGVGGGAE
jgi:hypothetical protein